MGEVSGENMELSDFFWGDEILFGGEVGDDKFEDFVDLVCEEV